jgi:hypothetical protein
MRFAWLLAAAPLVAQQGLPEKAKPAPPSFKSDMKNVPEVRLPAYQRSPESGLQPMKIGEHRALPADALKKGKWSTTPGGSKIWRLAVISPGAQAMRVHFRSFQVGIGRVWVHNGKDVGGPYTGGGTFGEGDFWSHTIAGERIVIEFAGEPRSGEVPFTMPEISHLWVE